MPYNNDTFQEMQAEDRDKRWAVCELTGCRVVPAACPRRLANPYDITRNLHSRQWDDWPTGPMLSDIAEWCGNCRIDVEARTKVLAELTQAGKRLGQVDNPNDISPYFTPKGRR